MLAAVKHVDVFDKSQRHQMIAVFIVCFPFFLCFLLSPLCIRVHCCLLFLQELKALLTDDCPHLVTLVGAFFDAGSTRLCLEFMNRCACFALRIRFHVWFDSQRFAARCDRQIRRAERSRVGEHSKAGAARPQALARSESGVCESCFLCRFFT